MSARLFVPRTALRQSRWAVQRRFESSAAETAQNTAAKAKEGASEVAGKAQQGLSKVSSSAGSAVSGAAQSASNAAAASSGRIGQAISFVQSLVPPTIYYARVAGELGSMVFKQRNMNPPTMQTVQSYLTPLQNALRNPSSLMSRAQSTGQSAAQQASSTAQQAAQNPASLLENLRSMDSATLTTIGVVAAETLGFFTVGEMIGRFKIVGYRGEHGHH